MESAIRLATECDERLYIYWVKVDDAMRESFGSMFESLPNGVRVIDKQKYSGWVRHLFSWKNPFRYKPGEEDAFIKRCFSARTNPLVAYTNCESFFPANNGGYDYSWLRPLSDIQEKIENEFSTFDGASVGVHIRRTDNLWATEHSTDEKFISNIDKEIENNTKVKIFLASDDETVKVNFIKRYGKRIHTRSTIPRHTQRGVADAVVDLFLLSKMKKIYGSYRSSFSAVASRIGGANLIVVS